MQKGRPPWDPRRRELLLRLVYVDKLSVKEAAHRLDCSVQTISYHLRKAGIEGRGGDRATAMTTSRDAAHDPLLARLRKFHGKDAA